MTCVTMRCDRMFVWAAIGVAIAPFAAQLVILRHVASEQLMAVISVLVVSLFLGFAVSCGATLIFKELHDFGAGSDEAPEALWRFAAIALLLFSGPFVLARETVAAQSQGDWPDAYLAGGYALSGAWGAALGFALLQVF